MDFTIDKYRELVLALKGAGYEFVRYDEYCEGQRAERMVVMRHDVDRSVERAKRLAEIEKEMDVKASYYFRERFIGDDVVCIASLGHEVGYHYEDLVEEKGDVDRAYARCMRNIEILRQLVDVRTITMHGSPMSGIDSGELWRRYNYRDIGIIGEPRFDINWSEMFYLTDTGRSWNGVSRRDKINKFQYIWENKCFIYRRTDDIIKALEQGKFPTKVMITIHPQRWSEGIMHWLKEFVFQSCKNVLKFILLKIFN